ncbi:MAG: carbohydrate ABC transporter permease [Eubacteriales bacterium]
MRKNKKSTKKIVQGMILNATILILSLVIIIPLLIVVFNSFKDSYEASKFELTLPTTFNFDNYIEVFNTSNIFQAMGNGAIYAISTCLVVILFASSAAFIVQRRKNIILYRVFIFGLVLPLSMIPTITLGQMLGIYGTRFNLVMIYSATSIPFCFFMYYNFISTIARELDEASIVDGAKTLQLYFQIILPLLKPVTFTLILITATNIWNDFYWQLYFTNRATLWGMPMTVYQYFGLYSRSWNLVAANIIIAVLPVLILFIAFQKQIVEGMTAGAVKG